MEEGIRTSDFVLKVRKQYYVELELTGAEVFAGGPDHHAEIKIPLLHIYLLSKEVYISSYQR